VIYRLVQEALNNVAKHAQAEAIRVRVVEDDAERAVRVEVHDDGRGFNPGDASEGFGLVGMRERVAAVGGTVAVESSPGEGTRLYARVPVARRNASSDGDRVASNSFGS
jgi:two-component system sensor histidine kinase UhpB